MPIANEFNVDLNPGSLASFGRFGSHTPYEPSAINQVGNQGQWWTEPPALEAQQSQRVGQQLSNPTFPSGGSFDQYAKSLGAQRREMSVPRTSIGPANSSGPFGGGFQEMLKTATYNENPYSFGQKVPGFTSSQQFYRDQGNQLGSSKNYWNQLGSSPAGGKFKQGYVGPEGGFIGWEGDMQRRYQDQLINSMRNVQGV